MCNNSFMKRIQPKPEVVENPTENKPLTFLQRVAYTIIDFGTMLMVFFGLYQLAMHTPISSNLQKANAEMIQIQIETGTSTGYFVKTYLEDGEKTNYAVYSDDGGKYYYLPNNDFKKDYLNSLNNNQDYKDLRFNYTVNSYVIGLGSLAISEVIFLLIIPLTNKRRATLGILFAGGQVMSKKYVSRAKWYQILGRFGFIYIIETALLYFAAGEVILLIVPFITLIISFTNKERRTIHDLVTGIKIVDKNSFVPLVDHDVVDETADKVE